MLLRLEQRVRSIAKPPPKLTLSQWAAENLMLSAEDSAEPGRYYINRAPYQRGIMDAISDPLIPEVVVMSSAQVGKTLLLKAMIGYFVDQDPSTILMLQPTLEMAETFSKDRLAPMVRDMPCLRSKIADPKARDSGNTILHKRFPGGHLTIVGANSAAGLASRPIRVLLCDEVDRYPASAGIEGDPINLARARTKTFWNRKIVLVSTPNDEDTSRINPAFIESDQRRYFVKCPHCDAEQHLQWANVEWLENHPDTAGYRCDECSALWTDAERLQAVKSGEWVAEFPERNVAGFHLNELYSPFRKLSEIVIDFLKSKDSPEMLKTWVNTSLGDVWRDQEGEKVDAEMLAQRPRFEEMPEGVLVITMQVDVQDDRLEINFDGWGKGEECWGIEPVVLHGDPGGAELWKRLGDQLARTFRREDGAILAVTACAIDSAGHYTKQVYDWAKKHRDKVHAIVGRAGKGRPLIELSKSKIQSHGIRLFIVGTDTAKELLLLSRVKITSPGAGYCHWSHVYSDTYFEQLTSEKRVVKYSMGRPTHAWVLPKGKRNEALDLRVYGLALISLLRPNFDALAERIKPDHFPQAEQPVARRPSSYLHQR